MVVGHEFPISGQNKERSVRDLSAITVSNIPIEVETILNGDVEKFVVIKKIYSGLGRM